MKKVLTLTLCLLAMLLVFAACAEEHQHTFDTQWRYDETNHWHDATCEHTEEVSDKGAHVFDGGDTCTVCSYTKDHVHTFADTWTSDASGHWHASTCGCQVKDAEAAHEKDAQGKCKTCGYQVCEHTYADTLTDAGDKANHWYAPTCGCEVDGKDKAEHVDAEKDGICDTCAVQFCEHTYATEWSSDADFHWYAATCGCAVMGEKATHVNADNNEECDVCKAKVEHIHTFEDKLTGDATGHWYATTCDHPNTQEVKPHTGFDKDGVCDECQFVVFKLYSVRFTVSGEMSLLDMAGKELKNNQLIKENTSLEFQIVVPKGWQLAEIANAEVSAPKYNEDGSATYTVVIKITVDGTNIAVTTNKLSAVEVIKEDSFTVSLTSWKEYKHTVTFIPEKDGEYVAVSMHDEFHVGDASTTDWMGKFTYTFEGKAGVPVELVFRSFPMNSFTAEVKYAIMQVDAEFELPGLKGAGYTVPTQANVTVTVTLPTKGVYIFTTQAGSLVWLADKNDTGVGDTRTMILEAKEDGAKATLTFRISDSSRLTYDFDWEIVKLAANNNLNLSENTIQVGKDYVGYTFTADKTGTYTFTKPDGMGIYTVGEYDYDPGVLRFIGYGSEVELRKGQTVTVYITLDPYSDVTEAFSGTLAIAFDGYKPEVDGSGNPTMLPDAQWEYEASENGQYTFAVPEGVEVSVDGGTTWAANKVVIVLKQGDKVTLMVRNTESAKVTITRVLFKHTVGVGEGALAFVPNQNYTVTLTGSLNPAAVKSYILTWTDTKLSFKLGDKEIVSGEAFDYDPSKDVLIAVYAGEAASVAINLIDNFKAPAEGTVLQPGTNEVIVSSGTFGKEMELLAAAGEYIIQPAYGEENALLYVNGELTAMPYTVEVADGATVKLVFTTANGKSDTLNIDVLSRADYLADLLDTLLDGNYVAEHPKTGMTLYELSFEYSWAERALVLTVVDSNNFSMVKLTGTYKVVVKDGVVVLTNTADDSAVTTFTLTVNDDGKLVLTVVSDNDAAYVLKADEGTGSGGETGGNTLVVGNNTVNASGSGIGYTFTATQAGTYIVTWTHSNAAVMIETATGSEDVDSGDKFTLAAGESFELLMFTLDWGNDSYEITITKDGASGDTHEHTFATEWSSDADGHWHAATCEHTDEKGDWSWHVDDNSDGKCDTCTYKMNDVYEVTLTLPSGAYVEVNGEKVYSGKINVLSSYGQAWLTVNLPLIYKLDSVKLESTVATKSGDPYEDSWSGMIYAYLTVTGNGEIKITADKKSVNAEYLFQNKQEVVTIPSGEWSFQHTFEIDIPAAGKYFVTGTVDSATGNIGFNQNNYSKMYTIEATAAGKYKVTLYGSWFYGTVPATVTLTYSVLKQPEATTIGLVGGLNIPAGISVELKLTLPEAGMYQISNSSNVSWYLNGVDMGSSFVYEATAQTLNLTLSVTGNGDFLWNVAKIEDYWEGIKVGSNELYIDGMQGVTFTAPLTGAYRLNATNGTIYLWQKQNDGSYKMVSKGQSAIITLVKDEVYKFYFERSGDGETSPQLYVESLGNMPEAESGVYKPLVGAINSFVATGNGTFELSVTDGKITVDGKTWAEKVEVEVAKGDVVYYMVQANDANANYVAMAIKEIKFEGTLGLGEGTLTLRPNKEYIITLTGATGVGPSYNKRYNYQVSWTDPNIKAYAYSTWGMGDEFESGYTINASGTVRIMIVYSGEATADITFTVKENNPVSVDFVEGTNKQELNAGTTYNVTLPTAATHSDNNMHYILTWNNTNVVVKDARGNVITSGTEFKQTARTITIVLSGENATVDFTVTCVKEEEKEETTAGNSLKLGDNVITDVDTLWGDYAVTFTATEDGTYVITATCTLLKGTSPVVLPYTITLKAGESISFYMSAAGKTSTITITKS